MWTEGIKGLGRLGQRLGGVLKIRSAEAAPVAPRQRELVVP